MRETQAVVGALKGGICPGLGEMGRCQQGLEILEVKIEN